VWVGFLSVVGLAMQTGVVMVVYIDEAFHRRMREGRLRSARTSSPRNAEGTVQRLRPKIMTITAMAASFCPCSGPEERARRSCGGSPRRCWVGS